MLNDQDYELLSAYMDGALTESERAALEARLLAETELRDELEALRGTVALIRALPVREAPRNFTLTRAMVQARRPAPRRFLVSSTAISFVSAAAAILLIGFSLVLLSGNRASAPQTSSSVALARTDTGFGESDTTLKTDEQPAAAPPVVDQVTTNEVARQNATEMFAQTSGGSAADTGTGLSQQPQIAQPQSTQMPGQSAEEPNDGVTANLEPNETDTEQSPPMLFAVPEAASGLPEPTASDFFYGADAAQIAGTLGLTGTPSQDLQQIGQQEQQGQETVPQTNASSAMAPAAAPTQVQPPTATLTASAMPSATPTVTATPTLTLTATATAAPTLTAAPWPAITGSTGTIDAPVVMLVAGILLLAVSGIFYVRSRRQA